LPDYPWGSSCALLVDTEIYVSLVWAGLGVGCAVLVVIYILIRFMSVHIPLKPFFMGTSVVLSWLVFLNHAF
jgi:high-affinity iron transporter